MGQAERLYKIKQQLDTGRCLGKAQLLSHLGVSPATLKRDITHLRERMNAPVVWDRAQAGWRLDAAAQLPGTQYELPGLWLTAEEIHALLTMQHLLAHLDSGGLLGPHTEPLAARLCHSPTGRAHGHHDRVGRSAATRSRRRPGHGHQESLDGQPVRCGSRRTH